MERLSRGRMAARALARVRRSDGNVLGLTRSGTIALVATVGALIGLHWESLDDGRAMAATFDPRPLGDVIGTAGACQFGLFSADLSARCDQGAGRATLRRFEGQEHTLVGLLADMGKLRRERGVHGDGTVLDAMAGTPVQPIYEQYRGQSGLIPPVRIERSSDGLYRFEGRETHNPPQAADRGGDRPARLLRCRSQADGGERAAADGA